MAETTREFLDRRERELTHQVSAFRQQIAEREAELAEIKAAKAALPPPIVRIVGSATLTLDAGQTPLALRVATAATVTGVSPAGVTIAPPVGIIKDPHPDFVGMTIKQLAVRALESNYPNGAALTALRDFIKNAYGRAIEPSSLRPQMHRLKAAGVVTQDPSTDTWNLDPEYRTYNHPSPHKERAELQDDEIPEGEPVTRLRDSDMAGGQPLDPAHPDFPKGANDLPKGDGGVRRLK